MDSLIRTKVDNFFHNYKLHKFAKKEHLLAPDNIPKGVYFLTRGIVRQYSTSAGGEEFVVNTFKSPSFFPMPWVLSNELPTHYYQAMDSVEVWSAPKNKFLAFLLDNPEVLLDLVKRVFVGLEGFTLRLESMMTGNAYARLVVEILIDAKRFGDKKGKGAIVKLRLTQDELAAQSGIARETVSREMKKLRDKGIVEFHRHRLMVTSIKRLENELLLE